MNETIAFLLTMAALIFMTWLVARQGRLAPLHIQFKDPRLEALIALLPTALLLGFVARYWILRSPAREVNPLAEGSNYTFGDVVNQLALSVIVLLPFVISMGLRKQEWDTIGISRRNLLPALFIGSVASLVAMVVNSRAPAAYWLAGGTLFKLLGQLFVGFSEEAVFRGYLQIRFSAWLPRAGWILVALIFSLWHIPQKLPGIYTAFSATAFSLALYFLYGLSAGWSMKRTGNIASLALLHAVINTVSDI